MKNRLKYFLLPSKLKKRFSYQDYLYYRLQERRTNEIEQFLNLDELWETEARLNNDAFRPAFNSKKLFYKRFDKYLKRDYLLLSEASKEDLCLFFEKYHKCVLKPDDMYAGLGIIVCDNISSLPISFETLKEKKYIIEEYVNSHPAYLEIYPLCLNTVRITTYINKAGSVQVIFAANQFGSHGSPVDNNDETAIWGVCDVDTGIVTHADIDSNTGLIYDKHPDTGMKIIGFKNPHWIKIKETALSAALEVPECRLVGWDIAVNSENEIIIIEGNVTPELDLFQRISGKGLACLLQD